MRFEQSMHNCKARERHGTQRVDEDEDFVADWSFCIVFVIQL